MGAAVVHVLTTVRRKVKYESALGGAILSSSGTAGHASMRCDKAKGSILETAGSIGPVKFTENQSNGNELEAESLASTLTQFGSVLVVNSHGEFNRFDPQHSIRPLEFAPGVEVKPLKAIVAVRDGSGKEMTFSWRQGSANVPG